WPMMRGPPLRAAPRPGNAVSSCRLAFGLDQLAVDQALGDLHRVERGALAQVVGYDPQHQAAVDCRILAHAADVGRVLARGLVGRDVAAGLALVDDETARRIAQEVASLVGADPLFGLDVDRLGMA